jgi:hypothetical protein
MASAWEAGGATNYKKQKQDFQSKKKEQMFAFFKKAYKEAVNETKTDDSKPAANKKRKNEDNFAFDDELFDEFDIDSKSDNDE